MPLLREGVELHHRTVGPVGKVAPDPVELADGRPHRIDAAHARKRGDDRQPPGLELPPERGLGVDDLGLTMTEPVADNLQPPARHEGRIERLERPGREIARIGIRRFPRFLLQLVDPAKLLLAQENLAANLDHRRHRRAFQCERQAVNRAHVRRHVVALLAVTARDRPHEFAVFIAQTHRHAVDLRLDRVTEVLRAEHFDETRVKLAQFGLIIGVVERGHRLTVLHACEALGAVVSDPLRRRLTSGRARRFGEESLEPGELFFQPVIVEISDLRAGAPVVQFVMTREGGAQLGNA